MTCASQLWIDRAIAQSSRYWRKVNKDGPESPTAAGNCWLWTCGKDADGYGKFAITAPRGEMPKQKHVRAHRVSYAMVHGPIGDDSVVMHACDTPACVNPLHLTLGTQADNRIDCGNKGRNRSGETHPSRTNPEVVMRGERHYKASITADTVRRIRHLSTEGHGITEISRVCATTPSVVSGIVYGKTWRSVA